MQKHRRGSYKEVQDFGQQAVYYQLTPESQQIVFSHSYHLLTIEFSAMKRKHER